MTQRRQIIAMALCAAMLLVMLISSAYIAHETAHPHTCCGEGCPVCQFIEQVEASLKGLSLILVALLALGFTPVARRERFAFAAAVPAGFTTPVAQKIRLND